MFQVLLTNIFNYVNKGAYLPTVNSAVLKWRQMDKKYRNPA